MVIVMTVKTVKIFALMVVQLDLDIGDIVVVRTFTMEVVVNKVSMFSTWVCKCNNNNHR